MIKIFKNFKEKKAFKPDFGAEGECVCVCGDCVCVCVSNCWCPSGVFGGFLLGVRSNSGLAFYDWENADLVRRIEIQPKHVRRYAFFLQLSPLFLFSSLTPSAPPLLQVFWSDSGELVCIGTDESFFVLRYLPERVAAAAESKEEITEDGIEGAFEVGEREQYWVLTVMENLEKSWNFNLGISRPGKVFEHFFYHKGFGKVLEMCYNHMFI